MKINFFIVLAILTLTPNLGHSADKIRKPMMAGSFYPADPVQLAQMVDGLLAGVQNPMNKNRLFALIAPHAGYVYSGHVAAESYAQLNGRNIERVVVIAPSHVKAFSGTAVYDGDSYETPLGIIPVDRNFCKALASKHRLIKLSDTGHESVYQGRGEHALEVQLPFLQRTLNNFSLVPVIMGDQSYQTCRALGRALADLISDDRTLIIASSDLSHFHPYDEAVQLDQKVIRAIQDRDYFNLVRNLQSQNWEACGGGPIAAAMIAAEQLGVNEAQLLKYANSGDLPAGDKSRVVGYAAIGFFSSEQLNKDQTKFSLNKQEQAELLRIAKSSVEEYVIKGKIVPLAESDFPALNIERGAFVTLEINSQLRGCIGYTAPVKPLNETVRDVAIQAAANDPRFPPVQKDELILLTFEISVLSPFTKVMDIKEIEVGVHGLLMVKGDRAGLLLPQVPVEQKWDQKTFLEQTCRKAGLTTDDWKNPETDIFKFTAFVFNDHKK